MKINKAGLKTKKETVTYQNDSRESNSCGEKLEQQFTKSKFLCVMVFAFYVLELGSRCVFW